jgi:site-specific recombinase XerD
MKIGKDIEDVYIQDYLEYLRVEKHNLRQGEYGRYADTTIRRKITSIRRFYKILTDQQIIRKNLANELPPLPVGKKQQHSIKTLDLQSVRTLLDAPNQSSLIGVRDKTILSVMVLAGLSVSEVHLLNLDDVSIEEQTLTVTGRCSRKRIVNLTGPVTKQIQKWLTVRVLLGNTNPAVFTSTRSHKGDSGIRRLSRRTLRQVVDRHLKSTDLKSPGVSCQTLRNTFAVLGLDNGARLVDVSNMLGISNQTAKAYETFSKMALGHS